MLETTKTLYKVSDFISWQRSGTPLLSPMFQRRSVWKPGAKSYLIDTMIRGLPIPIIFIREQRSDVSTLEPKREIVDGQQRLRTLFAFIEPSLLPDFDSVRDKFSILATHNQELAETSFTDLSTKIKQQILDYQFSTHVLPAHVDDREVLQIFARMNSTGVKLNDQELRNAEFFGEFKTSMYELATEQLQRWRDWRIFTEDNLARMSEVELTSEFALLMLRGLTGKSQAVLKRFYRDKDERFLERQEVERRFRAVMDTIDDGLGTYVRFSPFNRITLFYSLFAFFYDIQYGIGSPLTAFQRSAVGTRLIGKVKLVGERIKNKTAPKEVLDSVARRTTNPVSRSTVVEYLRSVK